MSAKTTATETPQHAPLLAAIDHVVMTVRDLDSALRFYEGALGVPIVRFGAGRTALQIGAQKINLHVAGAEIDPHSEQPTPGSLDICFLSELTPDSILARLDNAGIEVELGPVERTGAQSPILSIYIRDPDGNLVEIAAAAKGTAV